ncbi:hypothetical protein BMS3Bbin15_01740 [archaeon BMS3Bbin15]|nr:hypothetical protein BMS3Bbin15_01740 [archaeon BMS3Bbin15]
MIPGDIFIIINFALLIVIILILLQVRALNRRLSGINKTVEVSRTELKEIKNKLSGIDKSGSSLTEKI